MSHTVMQWSRQARTWACCFGIVAVSYWAAALLRFDFSIPDRERSLLYEAFLIVAAVKGATFCAWHLQLDRWARYSGFSDLVSLLRANLLASLLACVAIYSLIGSEFSRSVCCLDLLVCILFSGGWRFVARFVHELRGAQHSNGNEKGLLVYGAGVAGLALTREIRSNIKLGYRVIGFLDDDFRKHGVQLLGLPVLGSGDQARRIVDACRARRSPVHEIAVSMPSASGRQIRAAVEKGRAAGVPCRIVPGLGELISGKLHVANDREVSVTDLLGREPVNLDLDNVRRAVSGRTVLVTGAAGSIGSELCKQIARLEPRELLALDQSESELFRLEGELRDLYPDLALSAEIGDIRDHSRMEAIIDHGVNMIYHAAAYKHVPVMERQVCEAARNNVIGTWNLAQAAWRSNVRRFLMISTDKAVNPSSVMGLTKRVAELIVSASRPTVGVGQPTRFVCVRFGNVLVSNGSVVPIFRKQIAAGGPVTVTHSDMRRYFMTVQEAVHLVLEASTMGQGSEVFMLDMGKPVKIVDLARKMITLAGLVPDEDIELRVVGVRPGEKLFEELAFEGEHLLPTSHNKIRIYKNRQVTFGELVPWISELQYLLWRNDPEGVISHLRTLVPEYRAALDDARPGVGQNVSNHRAVAAAVGGAAQLEETVLTIAGS